MTYIVSAEMEKRQPDALEWAELKCLRDIVAKVHGDGFVGQSWPKVERLPMSRSLGEWFEVTTEEMDAGIEVDEWRIQVSVRAIPKGEVR